jgi:hypothetical protein
MKIPVRPPRAYRLRDAYRRRVWRSPLGVVGREVMLFGLAVCALGIVYEAPEIVFVAVLIAGLGATVAGASSVWVNGRRVGLVRRGPAVQGVLEAPRRVFVFHELFRGKREKSFVLPFRFITPNGQTRRGKIWICGCARPYLPEGAEEWIVYDPDGPRLSFPLRLSMMVAPH